MPVARPRRVVARPAAVVQGLERRALFTAVVVTSAEGTLSDPGSGTVTLADAVQIANASTSATTITFSPAVFASATEIRPDGRMELTNTKHPVTIQGPSATLTLDDDGTELFLVDHGVTAAISFLTLRAGGFDHPPFDVENDGTLALSNMTFDTDPSSLYNPTRAILNTGTLTVSYTSIDGRGDFNSGIDAGGGIYNSGTCTATALHVTDCDAGRGGGIFQAGGTFSLTGSTLSENGTDDGSGGGVMVAGGTFTATNCTFADDRVFDEQTQFQGSAIYVDSGGKAVLTNDTVDGCSYQTLSDQRPTTPAAVAVAAGGKLTLANTVVAGSTVGYGGLLAAGRDVAGGVTSTGHNYVGDAGTSTGWSSTDKLGTDAHRLDPKLGDLASNGGVAPTELPAAGSPLLAAGSTALVPAGVKTDQRGLPRVYNGAVDIGAVEVQPLLQVTAPANQTAAAGVAKAVALGTFAQYSNRGSYKDTISWGDGSANTVLTLSAAGGTIPAVTHTFAKAGTFTVTETVADAGGNKSNAVKFTDVVTASTASVAGTVFNDANADGKRDNGEVGLGLWTVYLDLNNNGKLDAGDKSATTTITGAWSFTGLAAGTYTVRVVPVSGVTATKPTGGAATIKLTAGQASVGNEFGERAS